MTELTKDERLERGSTIDQRPTKIGLKGKVTNDLAEVRWRQYLIVTANYWVFTISDGALRMLVLLYFHGLGYSAMEVAFLFLFYEFFGVLTNLFGGWLGARYGLNRTMNIGLGLQVCSLAMLLAPLESLTIFWVMLAQGLSGIAKDFNKMSAKSAIKNLVPSGRLFTWVATLTGSKNALKGMGFFLGAALYSGIGFTMTIGLMLSVLFLMLMLSLILLDKELGRSKNKPKFTDMFSNSEAINCLSLARFFLFSARDVWFVVALPVTLIQLFSWSHWRVGLFMAAWIIIYGVVQALVPKLRSLNLSERTLGSWAFTLSVFVVVLTALLCLTANSLVWLQWVLVVGLLIFAVIFAINSALHSFLVVAYAREDGASLDVGFYYMSNAAGRLLGTLLSGVIYQYYGLFPCLLVSALLLTLAGVTAKSLPGRE